MAVACVAVVGKANNPLYIKSVGNQDDPLKFHYIAHTALDIVEEKVATKKTASANQPDTYLGLLYPTEDYKVYHLPSVSSSWPTRRLDVRGYGYLTNTKIKFIVVIDDSYVDLKEAELRTFFKQFHAAFIEMVMNPFYVPDEKIDSKRFEKKVAALVGSFGKQ